MATKVKLIADGVITPDQITLTTASTGTNTTAPATTAFVQQEISALVDSSPEALNTLNELAAALGDDANFSTTVTNSIALKAPLASPTFTGDVTFDATTLVVDSTNNRVGIGTTSPDTLLNIASASAPTLRIENTDGSLGLGQVIGAVEFYKTDTSGAGAGVAGGMQLLSTFSTGSRNALTFSSSNADANNTEGFRLDEDGNLLVGTTNTLPANNNVEGIALSSGSYGGRLEASRSGGAPCSFNRVDSDGSIIELKEAGTTVGIIGAGSDELIIGTTNTGLRFYDFGDAIIPRTTANGVSNGATDLGEGSNRFKNLYLSGTANVGSEVVLDDSGTAKFAIGNSGNDFYIYSNATGTERMRITNAGYALFGRTNDFAGLGYKLQVDNDG